MHKYQQVLVVQNQLTKQENQLSQSFQNFTVYPNPTNNYIYISTKNNTEIIESLCLKNNMGQTVLLKTEETNSINLSNFSSGIYYLSIKTKSHVETFKIVKTN